jgi:hypothetical protein
VAKKKSPIVCGDRALKANSKNMLALNSASAFESQIHADALRVRRLARAGALASILAPFAFGEARS